MEHPGGEAERAVLAAVLLRPDLVRQLPLRADQFATEKHSVLWRAMGEVAARGEPLDLRTLQAELEDRGQLARVGGLAYLAALDLDLPDLAHASTYARIVAEQAAKRRMLKGARALVRAGREGATLETLVGQARGLASTAREVERGATPAGCGDLSSDALAEARERVERRRGSPTGVLGLSTGLEGLDELLGGLEPGVVTLAGGPGFGKTSLALAIAVAAAGEGPVAILSFEQSARELMLRVLCAEAGVRSFDVRRGLVNPGRLEEAAERLRPQLERMVIVEGSARTTPKDAERIVDGLRERTGLQGTGLLVIDYLQLWARRRSRQQGHSGDRQAHVEALAAELFELPRRSSLAVLAISSQSRARGAYGAAAGDAACRGTADLASMKDTGDLEYAADVAIFLVEAMEAHDEERRVVDLAVAKHRHGPTGTVRAVFHAATGAWTSEQDEWL